MLDVVDVGKECEFEGCTEHDFLPIKCRDCGKNLCTAHSSIHSCENKTTKSGSAPYSKSVTARNTDSRSCPVCVAEKCDQTVPTLIVKCQLCDYRSCIGHRHHFCFAERFEGKQQARDQTVRPFASVREAPTRYPVRKSSRSQEIGRLISRWFPDIVLRYYWKIYWATLGAIDPGNWRLLKSLLPFFFIIAFLWWIGRSN